MQVREDFIQPFVPERGLLSVAEMFHENTKVRRFDATWRGGAADLGLQSVYRQVKEPYKRLIGHPQIRLARWRVFGGLGRALRLRRSVRDFTGAPIALPALSKLLRAGCGVTGAMHLGQGHILLTRAAPSAGSLFPLELYAIVLSGEGIGPGVYHYAVRDNSLERVNGDDWRAELFEATLKQSPLEAASLVIAITGVSARSMFKYGDRGYRYMLLEAGHIAQNLYLLSGKLGLGGFTVGGFVDDTINRLLGVDGVNEYAVYLFVAGSPQPRRRLRLLIAWMRGWLAAWRLSRR